MSGIFTFKDNSAAVKRDLEQKLERALTVCGDIAVDYAKDNLRDFPRVDTGQLRNSIDSEVVMDEQAVYIGTNVEYAPYVELGTGKYATTGGRQTPWVYKDKEGNFHKTEGMRPSHFLKNAVQEHQDKYKQIFEQEMHVN